jgi:hypothetical protein
MGFFFLLVILLVMLVAQAASCQGDNHQRHYHEGDHQADPDHRKAQDAASGKELTQRVNKCVKGCVQQDDDKQASVRVVEDPCKDDGVGDCSNETSENDGDGKDDAAHEKKLVSGTAAGAKRPR